jgi:cobyrinic acid a,c-diamide synthase
MHLPSGRTGLVKGLIVAAPSSGSGKTTVTLGLLRALKNAGHNVASAKAGPDYIDPQFHAAATGQPCCNLDLWAMGVDACHARLSEGQCDITIIEGVMGLFDGPDGAPGSTADLAMALNLPVLLVIDCAHQAQSIAALVEGFRNYRTDVTIAGLFLNRVKSDRHLDLLQRSLLSLGIPIVGILRHSDSHHLPSRHLGLVQAQENQGLETFLETIASSVARETKLDKLFQIATPLTNHRESQPNPLPPLGQNMAIARDEAFAFAYPHLLTDWQKQGANLSFFSPLNDEAPDSKADAIFLPGGYPELHAGKLAANSAFREGLRQSEALIYGECGGYMVLGNALIDAHGVSHTMAGLLPVTTSFKTRKLSLGYRQLAASNGPWAGHLRGHEFHYSTIAQQSAANPLYAAKDAAGNELGTIGQRVGQVMGSYAHVISRAPT